MNPENTNLVDLSSLTQERMADFVGESFQLEQPGRPPVALLLSEAKRLGAERPDRRAPFSLIFRPGRPDHGIEQQSHMLSHPLFGRAEIFIVPIRPDQEGPRIEAVFT